MSSAHTELDKLSYRFRTKHDTINDKILKLKEAGNKAKQDASSSSLNMFAIRLEDLGLLREMFDQLIDDIINSLVKSSPRPNIDLNLIIREFDENYYEIIEYKNSLLKQEPPQAGTSANAASSTQSPCPRKVQLPFIHLPTFSGEISEWTSFIELFNSLIDKDPSLSDTEKHIYLRSSVAGEPKQIISRLQPTASNYPIAKQLLQKRYENLRNLTNSHLTAILDFPPLVSQSAQSLRDLANIVHEKTALLKTLKHKPDEWGALLLFILERKIENLDLFERWQAHILKIKNYPSVNDFLTFISDQANIISNSKKTKKVSIPSTTKSKPIAKPHSRSSQYITNLSTETQTASTPFKACPHCQQNHILRHCEDFKKLDNTGRKTIISKLHLCGNCLKPNHQVSTCKSRFNCSVCKGRHNTLLCGQNCLVESKPTTACSMTTTTNFMSHGEPQNLSSGSKSGVLLSTVQGSVQGTDGQIHKVRILLDSASEANFISEKCFNTLKLAKSPCNVSVRGMAQTTILESSGKTTCCLQSCTEPDFVLSVDLLIIPHIAITPKHHITPGQWDHIVGLTLGDPDYHTPGPVDMLLGSSMFSHVLLGGRRVGPDNTPSALNTAFGWTLLGKAALDKGSLHTVHTFTTTLESLDNCVRQFWEIEEPPNLNSHVNPDASYCEELFQSTVSRDQDGRYQVALPFKNNPPPNFLSYNSARLRYLNLERSLQKSPEKRFHYQQAFQDYVRQSHMSCLGSVSELAQQGTLQDGFYLPHFAVIRKGEPPSKVRIVFDASVNDENGRSLNSMLHTGPKLQQDLTQLLLGFRLHPFVFIADIKQMYRQVLLRPEDRKFHKLLWRESADVPLMVYEMNRVTFGVSSSPFLALRAILQLVQDEGLKYPLAAKSLSTSTYVDDVLGKASSLSEACQLRDQLIAILGRGCFELGKWVSPHQEILTAIPVSNQNAVLAIPFHGENDHTTVKVLGVQWKPNDDIFSYSVKSPNASGTKRQLLSDISSIFDPCGWVGPVTMLAKQLMQHTWLLGISWDDSLPEYVQARWETIRNELHFLSQLSIPRFVFSNFTNSNIIELHAFADASTKGYGSVIYVRIKSPSDTKVNLWMSKSKVAPLKQVSVARLELCAALLASNLLATAQSTFCQENLQVNSITVWSDSTVTLHWVRSPSYKWQTFVANRVSQIHSLVSPENFRYVHTELNPADCLSRGLTPRELVEHPLWLSGPSWLTEDEDRWPRSPPSLEPLLPDSELEAKPLVLLSNVTTLKQPDNLISEFSSLTKLCRITAYCFRFVNNIKKSTPTLKGSISVQEIKNSLNHWIRSVQRQEFNLHIEAIKAHKPVKDRYLRKLMPFIDSDNILRVGGRLQFSSISFNKKHPVLLPKSHHLTTLIIQHYHFKYLHPGPRSLLSILQENYWIIGGKSTVRKITSTCVKCFRAKPANYSPIMGNLPALRVQQAKPFSNVGIDYAGPISLYMSRLRKATILKGYLAIFVCLAVKAVHIELVSDLSTDTFIAALRRFIARRGRVATIVSDCGTNFQGASNKLATWCQAVCDKSRNDTISKSLADIGIKWTFIPPSAPHFGGLWEAGVKSVKSLLLRTIGDQILTYEEYTTVLAQVEASLNSRPLCPASTDPSDFVALTPGHFLFQEPPFTFPEPYEDRPVGLTARWALIQQVSNQFWKVWHKQYLTELQQRHKWNTPAPNLSSGMLVLVRDDNLPPLKWTLGRIVDTFPGNDGVVRVAAVKTPKGIFRRPVVKLCPLPVT